MIDNTALVSIITPSYNSEKFIEDTIKSVLMQSYQNWEMLIIDDGSIDLSVDIISKYCSIDSRIKLYYTDGNKGPAVARNIGIERAIGKYIAFLDSDDLWLKDKLMKQINYMEKNNCNFTFTEFEKIDENNKSLKITVKCPFKITYTKLLIKNPIGCLTAVYNQNNLGKIYMPLLLKRQDYALWLQILKKEEYAYSVQETLAYYRVRKKSVSSNKIKLIKYNWSVLRKVEQLSVSKSFFCLGVYIFLKLVSDLKNKIYYYNNKKKIMS